MLQRKMLEKLSNLAFVSELLKHIFRRNLSVQLNLFGNGF